MAASRRTFLQLIEDITPWWLRAGDGGAVLQSLAVLSDLITERIQRSVLMRFPSKAPEDALPELGKDRALPRISGEPVDLYRNRLLGWRGEWGHRYRGHAFTYLYMCSIALAGALREIGVGTVDRSGNRYQMPLEDEHFCFKIIGGWNWDDAPASPRWARGWLVAHVTAERWPTWGAMLSNIWAGRSGAEYENSSVGLRYWRRARAAALRGLTRGSHPWKMAGSRVEYAIVMPNDVDDFPFPDGTWGRWWGSTRPREYTYLRLDGTKRA